MWFRIFARTDVAPEPAQLLEHLHAHGLEARGDFRGDTLGWMRADLTLEGEEPIRLERYLATEDRIRDELNSWAAWLETVENNRYVLRLMQHVISAAQVFTLQAAPDVDEDDPARRLCIEACRYLAQQTNGVYQVDNEGFFAPKGDLLVKE